MSGVTLQSRPEAECQGGGQMDAARPCGMSLMNTSPSVAVKWAGSKGK